MENKAYKNYAALAAAYVANGRKPVSGEVKVAGVPATAEIRADGSALIIYKGERYELRSYLSLPSRYAGTADGRHVKAAVGAAWTRVRGHAADKAPARPRAGASGKPSACRTIEVKIEVNLDNAAAMAAFRAALEKARQEYAAEKAAYEKAAAERAAAERAAASRRRLESLARKMLGITDKEGAELMLTALLNREGMADAASAASAAVARVSAAAAAAEKSKEEALLLANKEEN